MADLLRCEKSVIDEVKEQINKIIEDQLVDMVQSPIEQMVNLLGPTVWMGWGADAFADDCNSAYISEVMEIQTSCRTIIEQINSATEALDAEDAKGSARIDEMADKFAAIYK